MKYVSVLLAVSMSFLMGCRENRPLKATPAQIQRQNELVLEMVLRNNGEHIAISAARHNVSLDVALNIVREIHLGWRINVADAAKAPKEMDEYLDLISKKYGLPKETVAAICWDVWLLGTQQLR